MPHLPKNHPVRFLVESAANGRKLTDKDLSILEHAELPVGESLTAYRATVTAAAARVAAAGAGGGNNQEARRLAETEWSNIASRMSPDQLAVDNTSGPDDAQNINSMVAGIFNN